MNYSAPCSQGCHLKQMHSFQRVKVIKKDDSVIALILVLLTKKPRKSSRDTKGKKSNQDQSSGLLDH